MLSQTKNCSTLSLDKLHDFDAMYIDKLWFHGDIYDDW